MTLFTVDGPAEGRRLAHIQAEGTEAVEQVATDLPAEVGADGVVRPGQGLRRRQPATDRDALPAGTGSGEHEHHSNPGGGHDPTEAGKPHGRSSGADCALIKHTGSCP